MGLGVKIGEKLGSGMMHMGTNHPKVGTGMMAATAHVGSHPKMYSALGGLAVGHAVGARRSSHTGIDTRKSW